MRYQYVRATKLYIDPQSLNYRVTFHCLSLGTLGLTWFSVPAHKAAYTQGGIRQKQTKHLHCAIGM
jgi:hypothetical protein